MLIFITTLLSLIYAKNVQICHDKATTIPKRKEGIEIK